MSDDDDGVRPEDIDNSPSELPESDTKDLQFQPNYRAKFFEVSEDLEYLKEQNGKLRVRIRDLESTAHTNEILDSLIVPMAQKIFNFMCIYCASVGLLLAFASYKQVLSDKVLKVLVGSTAITVIGLVGTIVAGIFAGARRHSR